MEAGGIMIWALIAWFWIWPESFGRQIGKVVHHCMQERHRLTADNPSAAKKSEG